ncbi:MAG TPA: hypothetical protein VIJ50_14210 [Solirubrobacteraceae bacterium]
MDLTIIDETGTRTEQVSVPDAAAAGSIAARLVQMMGLPGTGADGLPLVYGFRQERTGRQIGGQEKLAQAGVNEHDVLRLVALTPAQAGAVLPQSPSTEAPLRAPGDLPPAPPETTVLSPPPPSSSQPSPPPAMVGGRWSPVMAIAVIALAVALVGVAVAITVSRGGKSNAHALANDFEAGAAASTGTTETSPDGSGEQATGETGEDTTTTSAEGLLPAVSTQQMESEIQQMLRDWHEDVVRGDYHAAWELLSRRKQAQDEREQGYATWKKNQSTLRPYLNPAGLQVSIQSTEPSGGVAQVDVTGMKWDRPGASCSEWSGITWVKYEAGEWRYDPGYSTTPQREQAWKPRYSELLGGSC